MPCTAKGSPHPSVTVLGVILGFNLPTRTKTNQWMISISIVDPSLPTTDDDQSEEGLHTITVNVFRKKRNDLPCVRQVGDLIRLQDAGIQVSYHWIFYEANQFLFSWCREYVNNHV